MEGERRRFPSPSLPFHISSRIASRTRASPLKISRRNSIFTSTIKNRALLKYNQSRFSLQIYKPFHPRPRARARKRKTKLLRIDYSSFCSFYARRVIKIHSPFRSTVKFVFVQGAAAGWLASDGNSINRRIYRADMKSKRENRSEYLPPVYRLAKHERKRLNFENLVREGKLWAPVTCQITRTRSS